jgi:hypothetical protein
MSVCGLVRAAAAAGALLAGVATAPAQEAGVVPAAAAPVSWDLGGSLFSQPYAMFAGARPFENGTASYGSATTLSLDLRARGEHARAEGSVEASVLTGAAAALAWTIAQIPAFARPDELLVPVPPAPAVPPAAPVPPPTIFALRVRTLYLKLDPGWASLTLGRQVVNYGRGALWSPTDIFTELDLTGLSPVRLGTDALRLTVPLGATAGVDVVAAPTLDPAAGRYALRVGGLLGDVDGTVMAARDGTGKGWVFGADFKADVVLGVFGEAVYRLPDSGGPGAMRAAAGADWSFDNFIVAAEYYFNGDGAADPLFPGTHNVYASLTWTPTELVRCSALTFFDVVAGTGTATILTAVSVAQNAALTVFLQAGNSPAGLGLGAGAGASTWVLEAGLNVEVKF